ncbi:type-F conjugative transfer system protein TrbI [Yersinia enterocolitica]|uniref:type-F conjugative transfer system protein TrbI n=1 Tax=Yersinia enterocolitica TaxID=630 RepID=UPI001C8DD786|nr:type-F conjugative transfer system protein TrbI [Yersinia enterocolitica]MBX9489499.1 type-F conjugative transfer system protein TrbI [Yersinia enterocolitica]MBX9492133.1 type-F conjugative transfer system protein TrbI [Yersinia enterocolitica]
MTDQHSTPLSETSLTADTVRQSVTSDGYRNKRSKRRRRCVRALLLTFFSITCINAGVTSLLITWRAPTVVSFDMKDTLDRFTEQAAEQSLDEEQTKALTVRFMASLSNELQVWQNRHDALILVTPAVVSGTADITDEIQSAVAQKMSAGDGR